MAEIPPLPEDRRDESLQLFKAFDFDSGGTLDLEEFTFLMCKFTQTAIPQAQVAKTFEMCGGAGCRGLQPEHFERWVSFMMGHLPDDEFEEGVASLFQLAQAQRQENQAAAEAAQAEAEAAQAEAAAAREQAEAKAAEQRAAKEHREAAVAQEEAAKAAAALEAAQAGGDSEAVAAAEKAAVEARQKAEQEAAEAAEARQEAEVEAAEAEAAQQKAEGEAAAAAEAAAQAAVEAEKEAVARQAADAAEHREFADMSIKLLRPYEELSSEEARGQLSSEFGAFMAAQLRVHASQVEVLRLLPGCCLIDFDEFGEQQLESSGTVQEAGTVVHFRLLQPEHQGCSVHELVHTLRDLMAQGMAIRAGTALGAQMDLSHRLGVTFGGGDDDFLPLDSFLKGSKEPSFVNKLKRMFDELDVEELGEVPLSQVRYCFPEIAELVGLKNIDHTPTESQMAGFVDVQRLLASLESKGWDDLTFDEFKALVYRTMEVFEFGLSEEECNEMHGFVDADQDGIDDRYQLHSSGSPPPQTRSMRRSLSPVRAVTAAAVEEEGEEEPADPCVQHVMGQLGTDGLVLCRSLVDGFNEVCEASPSAIQLSCLLLALSELDLDLEDCLDVGAVRKLLARSTELSGAQEAPEQDPQLQDMFDKLTLPRSHGRVGAGQLTAGLSKLTAALGMKSAMKLRGAVKMAERYELDPSYSFDLKGFCTLVRGV